MKDKIGNNYTMSQCNTLYSCTCIRNPNPDVCCFLGDPGCGGTFTDSEGIIISPNWPNDYAHNRQCIYLIRLPAGERVALNFTHMNLESHSNCLFDYVEVRDGRTETDPLIGKYCGSTLPAPMTSSSNFLWIRFRSDSSVSRAACGGTLSGTGQLRSPYHPNAYPHNKVCEWVINQPQGYVVTLNFLSFDVEGGSCRFDFVEVRDGSLSSSPLLGKFCGIQIPPRLQSTQRSMYIKFKTDSSVSNHGFEAAYSSALEGEREDFLPGNCSCSCGDTLTSPSGTITSPGHPTNYPHGANCTWYISVTPGNLIRLSFESFNLEYHLNCNYDYVEVYDNGTVDGGYETSPLIGKFCSNQRPPVLVSHSNRLWVRFRSDSSVTRRGFTAHWDGSQTVQVFTKIAKYSTSIHTHTHLCAHLISSLVFQGCGGTLTTASGGFSSPNYPLPYHPNSECYWNIRTSQGSQLLLSFSDFHLESSASCSYDYLAVYDGNSSSAPELARLCGSQPPSTFSASSNQLYVKLRTDSSVKGVFSFSHDYCSGMLIANRHRGVVESLNFPNDYPANSFCSWTIQATTGNTINYTFTTFQLEATSSCNYDYVKLYNGPNNQAPLIGTFCGYTPPPANSTTSSALTMVFRSDSSVSMSGFQMMWYQNGKRQMSFRTLHTEICTLKDFDNSKYALKNT
uniref:CUB domain-containing protein n=1 Tax=Lates calcarifer TaxID=8187 RepID=A0A4W6DZH6_LATCA